MDSIRISDDRLKLLRQLFDEAYDTLDDAQWITNQEQLRKVYNIENVDRVMQTKRGQPSTSAREFILDCVQEFAKDNHYYKKAHINFARAFYPIAIHVDVPPPPNPQDGDTIIIPLTFNEQIKTVWWKGQVYNPIFDFWLEEQNYFRDKEKLNNIRQTYNLENAFWTNPEVVDYMEVDGIASWEKGIAFRGRRSQPHCSTNFLKSNLTHKDYILIQTNEV